MCQNGGHETQGLQLPLSHGRQFGGWRDLDQGGNAEGEYCNVSIANKVSVLQFVADRHPYVDATHWAR